MSLDAGLAEQLTAGPDLDASAGSQALEGEALLAARAAPPLDGRLSLAALGVAEADPCRRLAGAGALVLEVHPGLARLLAAGLDPSLRVDHARWRLRLAALGRGRLGAERVVGDPLVVLDDRVVTDREGVEDVRRAPVDLERAGRRVVAVDGVLDMRDVQDRDRRQLPRRRVTTDAQHRTLRDDHRGCGDLLGWLRATPAREGRTGGEHESGRRGRDRRPTSDSVDDVHPGEPPNNLLRNIPR